MKTVRWRISTEQADALLNQLVDLGFMYFTIRGCLQDNYICDLGNWESHKLKMGRFKLRRYLLIKEVSENPWSSGLLLVLTDDDSVYEAWMKEYETQEKEGATA